jgi:hypothetical protein
MKISISHLNEVIVKSVILLLIIFNADCSNLLGPKSSSSSNKAAAFQECIYIEKVIYSASDNIAFNNCMPCLVLNCRPNFLK